MLNSAKKNYIYFGRTISDQNMSEQYPDLHSLVWNAGKLAGRNKQTVDASAAEDLVGTVDKIAEIFWNTKNVTYSDPNAEVRFGA